ncbi:MAG: alpha/beta family hydrolase [Hyphomicrobiaceae bacterium]
MTSIPLLVDEAEDARATLLLAHGSGLPMDSPFMTAFARLAAERGMTALRFEFPYMADRRTSGSKRPPPRADKLCDFYLEAIDVARKHTGMRGPLLIGGKSLGGRVASMVADIAVADGSIRGVVCLGYPFHPPKKPETLRTAHLADLVCPTLICQGTRDPLGTAEEVAGYTLSNVIKIVWLEDGDHDFVPRKRSGRTQADNLQDAVDVVASFADSLL